jgi:hypothetical protein
VQVLNLLHSFFTIKNMTTSDEVLLREFLIEKKMFLLYAKTAV